MNLPDNIINLEVLRVNHNARKLCTCYHPTYVVDSANRLVTCGECGAIVDAFQALSNIAYHHESLRNNIEALLEQRRQIESYKPHMVVFRELERQYRGKKMLPACPICDEAFFFEDIKHWIDRKFMEKLRNEG